MNNVTSFPPIAAPEVSPEVGPRDASGVAHDERTTEDRERVFYTTVGLMVAKAMQQLFDEARDE